MRIHPSSAFPAPSAPRGAPAEAAADIRFPDLMGETRRAYLAAVAQAAAAPPANGEMPDVGPVQVGQFTFTRFPPYDAPGYFVAAWEELRNSGLPERALDMLRFTLEQEMYGSPFGSVPVFGADMTYTELVAYAKSRLDAVLQAAPEVPPGELSGRREMLVLLMEHIDRSIALEAALCPQAPAEPAGG